VQIAPSVRVALGEAFGYPPGTNLTGKIYAALRRLGFKAVFDTNFSADLTIMEEASEFVQRFVHGKGPLPLITSCCPAWTDYMEKFHHDFIENFSTAKSPQQMLGVMAKTYYAEKMGIDPAALQVSIMPCTAKKYELERTDEMFASGYQDVDVTLTTRELARMIKQSGIDFDDLPDGGGDSILGDLLRGRHDLRRHRRRDGGRAAHRLSPRHRKEPPARGARHQAGARARGGQGGGPSTSRAPRCASPSPTGWQRRQGARQGARGAPPRRGAALSLHRGDGLPRRLHRRRRPALRVTNDVSGPGRTSSVRGTRAAPSGSSCSPARSDLAEAVGASFKPSPASARR
jgi:hypothetical protein